MTSSNQDIKTNGYFNMQKRSARFMFYPSLCFFFVYTCIGKVMLSSRCIVLLDDVASSLDPTLSFKLGHFLIE